MQVQIDFSKPVGQQIIAFGQQLHAPVGTTNIYDGAPDDYSPSKYDYIPAVNGAFNPSDFTLSASYVADQNLTNTALTNLKNTAQSAVGVTLANLTTAQVRALMAILLYKAGGVDRATLTVKPLNQWV